jgi:acyl-CoA thioester hydrolase
MPAQPTPETQATVAAASAFGHPLRVYWEDTDAGGVVFHANYLRFFERARTEWLRALGFSQQRMLQCEGVMFVVAATSLRYLSVARLDDRLRITVELAEAGRASLRIRQQAWRDAVLLAEGEIRIGCVEADARTATGFRPCRIPAAILDAIT